MTMAIKKFISLDELKVFKNKVYEKFIKKPTVAQTEESILVVSQDGTTSWIVPEKITMTLIDDDTSNDAGTKTFNYKGLA